MSCLTAAQVQTAKMIYAPAKDPKTGKLLTGGLMPGTELQWGTFYSPTGYGNAIEAMKYIAMKDPNWDSRSSPRQPTSRGHRRPIPTASSGRTTPTSKAFFDRAGSCSCTRDSPIRRCTSENAIRYHQMVLEKVGRQAEAKSISLFMIPGMYHCQGGPGPTHGTRPPHSTRG